MKYDIALIEQATLGGIKPHSPKVMMSSTYVHMCIQGNTRLHIYSHDSFTLLNMYVYMNKHMCIASWLNDFTIQNHIQGADSI